MSMTDYDYVYDHVYDYVDYVYDYVYATMDYVYADYICLTMYDYDERPWRLCLCMTMSMTLTMSDYDVDCLWPTIHDMCMTVYD